MYSAYSGRSGWDLGGGGCISTLHPFLCPNLQTSSATCNFGDTPFAYGPMLLTSGESDRLLLLLPPTWIPLASTSLVADMVFCFRGNYGVGGTLAPPPPPAVRLVRNPRVGWTLVTAPPQYPQPHNVDDDASSAVLLSADRLCARALLHAGWQVSALQPSTPGRSPTVQVRGS